MKIELKVKARAKEDRVEKTGEAAYKVWVKAVADKGKANEAVIAVLSEYLDVPKASLRLVAGHTHSRKVIEIVS